MYMMLHMEQGGVTMPLRPGVQTLRRWLRPAASTSQYLREVIGEYGSATSSPGPGVHRTRSILPQRYVVLLERSDALSFRRMDNFEEVSSVLSSALSQRGVVQKVLRATTLPFQEQVRLISGAEVLVGVTGAGLTHVVFLPANGALVEIVTAKRLDQVHNFVDKTRYSGCGFTPFWYLASMCDMQYRAIALHDSAWDDNSLHVPPDIVAQNVLQFF